MNQIRHFFRYEIPGYLSFIYVFIIMVSTLEKSIIVAYILPKIHSIALAGFLIAIPIGWIIYQIYDNFRFKGLHCHPETINKVKGWFGNNYLDDYLKKKFDKESEKNMDKIKKIYFQQAIDIGIYSNGKDSSNHFELHINNLSNKYNSYDSRSIVGLWVPIFSIVLSVMIYLWFSEICKFNFIDTNSCRLWFIFVFVIIIGVISYFFIFSKKRTINKAIQAQEDFLISINKGNIKEALKSLIG